MATIIYPEHPCNWCGAQTTNKTYCSHRCRGLGHVKDWTGKNHSEETKAAYSKARKGFVNPHIKEIQRLAREAIQAKHPSRSIECASCGIVVMIHFSSNRRYCSKQCAVSARTGKPHTREQLSAGGYGINGVRNDLGFYVRSRWEANYARYLRHIGKHFVYEPERFPITLPDGRLCTYSPDFLIDNEYFEIKGYWRNDALLKAWLFQQQHNKVLTIIDKAAYERIETEYGTIIEYWEWPHSPEPEDVLNQCRQCGAIVHRKRQYCSNACHGNSRVMPRTPVSCKRCGKPFTKNTKSATKAERDRQYCSHRCATQDNIRVALSVKWAKTPAPNNPASA